MSLDQPKTKVVARIWQSITQSGVSVSSIPQDQLNALVDAIADGVLVAVDELFEDAGLPSRQYAAEALGRVVRHYTDTEDYAQAGALLENVFANYPDAAFLDEMLMLWAKVAYKMGDAEMSKAKLRQLIFDYPSSKHVGEAQKKLAAMEAK